MAIITKSDRDTRVEVKVKTRKGQKNDQGYYWWKAKSKAELGNQLLDTVGFLKEQQQYRQRQASIYSRMYGNLPLSTYIGSSLGKMNTQNNLPTDRPTMNVIQSCVDTLVSRLTQAKPKPVFLTDGSDYRNRKLTKQMNTFIAGEMYKTKAYELGETILKDASVLGDGVLKVFREHDKVKVERILITELLVDQNDAFYGSPRCIYQLKLIDRDTLVDLVPEYRSTIEKAEQAYPDNNETSQKTISDQVMLVEAWHLPSGPDADDGRHVIACTSGVILDEEYCKDDFPFVFLRYSPRMVGFWSQGLPEQLSGTQIEINKLLLTISQSINLVGVPRVFVEDGSKVVKAHLNNNIGAIITYRGTKPQYEVAPCVPAELYQQLQRLVDYAYQQSGVSALSAAAQKPAGLNSGEAIRNFDDLQSDRFATLNKRYDQMYIHLVNKMLDVAIEIAEETGKYDTIYPNKDGVKEINLPEIEVLRKNPFVVQCFDSNSLPKDPAGRKQAIVDDMQAGILTLEEGRRLLNYSDLEQEDKLAIAPEERILKQLDDIVEEGKYTPPDPFINISLAKTKVMQYYNLYVANGLEESRQQMLRDYQTQLLDLEQAAMPPMAPGMPAPAGAPSVPQAPPTSDLKPMA